MKTYYKLFQVFSSACPENGPDCTIDYCGVYDSFPAMVGECVIDVLTAGFDAFDAPIIQGRDIEFSDGGLPMGFYYEEISEEEYADQLKADEADEFAAGKNS